MGSLVALIIVAVVQLQCGDLLGQELKSRPPSEAELERPRKLLKEIYPTDDKTSRSELLQIIADMRSVADREDTSFVEKYAIWVTVEELAIRSGEAGVWASTIDSRLRRFADDHWQAESEGLLSFARSDGAAFAKSDLVERTVKLAEHHAGTRSTQGGVAEAVAFLEAIRKSSSRLATYTDAMKQLADCIDRIESKKMGKSTSTPVASETANESRIAKRTRLARERFAPDAIRIGDHYYKVVLQEKIPWDIAVAQCNRMGGYLACIETEEERRSVAAAIGTPKVLWLGGRILPNGKPFWLTGDAITTTVAKAKKKNYTFLAFSREGHLNTRPKSGNSSTFYVRHIKGFLCEWDY